jgi:hypothetical protein
VEQKILTVSKSKKEISKLLFEHSLKRGTNSKDFFANAYLDDIETIYLPFHFIQVNYNAEWSASFGFDRVEHYTEYRKKVQADKSYYMEPVTKTKTVTDWKLSNGRSSGLFSIFLYAGSDYQTAGKLIENSNFSLSGLKKSFQENSVVETDFSDYDGCRRKNSSRIDTIISSDVVQKNRKGDRQKDWSVSYEYKDQNEEIYIPIYKANLYFRKRKKSIFITTGSVFSTTYEKIIEDDKAFLENNEKTVFWIGASIFSLMVFWSIWSLLAGACAYFFHNFVMDKIQEHADSQYSAILSSRKDGPGFIGIESIEPSAEVPSDSFWRTKNGLRRYSGIILTFAFCAIIAGVIWPYGVGDIFTAKRETPINKVVSASDTQRPVVAKEAAVYGTAQPAPAIADNQPIDDNQLPVEVEPEAPSPVNDGISKPSFNCAVGTTPSELFVCGSAQLAKLDVELAAAYKQASGAAKDFDESMGAGSAARAELIGAQSLWISGNNRCKSESCLESRYLERLAFLRDYSPN